MPAPTLVRLLQDAEGELARAADSVPESLRDATGFDSAAYVLAHATETHAGWILGSVGGQDEDRGVGACGDSSNKASSTRATRTRAPPLSGFSNAPRNSTQA